MKPDITSRADIELLIDTFYSKVRADDKIGHIFSNIIGADWSQHLPVMYRFWESVLFSRPGYEGNPIRKHVEVDKRIQLQKEHFDRWLQLWNETADELYEGENAALAKNKAMLMANLISIKVETSRDSRFIA